VGWGPLSKFIAFQNLIYFGARTSSAKRMGEQRFRTVRPSILAALRGLLSSTARAPAPELFTNQTTRLFADVVGIFGLRDRPSAPLPCSGGPH